MTYSKTFFHLAVQTLTGSLEMANICAPLMYDEFNAALEPSFLNGSVSERLNELVDVVRYGAEFPSWYKNAVSRAMNRVGGTDPFAEKIEE